MLTLHLTLTDKQITVRADGARSHSFPLTDLGQTEKEWKAFTSDPRLYGMRLFQALFKDGSESRKAFDELSKQGERGIVLVLESPDLDGIAWEYAYNEVKAEYVVEDCAFVRALPESERPANGRIKNEVERVPLLFIPANPLVDLSGEPMRELDIEGEWREMTQHIVRSNAPFDLIELRPATPAALQSMMARFQNGMIAHFSGHGAATKNGAFLLFENENGASNPLEAREFVREVKDQAWIGFLSACQSAVAERTEFGNLARELVKAGVPFALGMQFNLPDPFAPNISGQFYNYLAQGHAVPEAARQARRAVKRENEFYVGMIALYAAHPDEARKMGWSGHGGARTLSTFTAAEVSNLPIPGKFLGRQRELMNIGTSLLGKKKPNTVTLHGAGGIGKTALMRQALLRFAPSFESALALALDPLPSLESVLGRLERFLNLPSPCSIDTKEREQIVRGRLSGRQTLLGLDNFETLSHANQSQVQSQETLRQAQGEALESRATAKSLYAFFKSLAAEGVTLCVTSRKKTSLPGETIQKIRGLDDAMGGELFYENVSTRRDALNEAGLEKLSAAVGGHPLALRLLAPIFEEQAGLTLDDFVQKLQTFLPKARDEWTEQKRHESLGACFASSMDNLPAAEEGKELQTGLSRLSIFTAFFAPHVASPVLAGNWPENEAEDKTQQDRAKMLLNALWERGLLEHLALPLNSEENFSLYRLHPALNQFAAERVAPEDIPAMQENYFRAMRQLASRAHPASEGGGIYASPFLATLARFALPDMFKAAKLKQDKEASTLLYHLAFLNTHFGDLDGAMKLYQQSLEICEGLGDLRGKSATLHQMAGIYVTRGDLDGAMKLYQQSLEICEGLGDLQGKSATLANMGIVLFQNKQYPMALKSLMEALITLEKIGARPDVQAVANLLIQFRQALGAEEFDMVWQTEIRQPIPDWLTQQPQQNQGMTAEQFIAGAIQSAREKSPEAEGYFKEAQRLAIDSNAPAELRELGRVLQRIMVGERKVDLSALTEEMREAVEKELRQTCRRRCTEPVEVCLIRAVVNHNACTDIGHDYQTFAETCQVFTGYNLSRRICHATQRKNSGIHPETSTVVSGRTV